MATNQGGEAVRRDQPLLSTAAHGRVDEREGNVEERETIGGPKTCPVIGVHGGQQLAGVLVDSEVNGQIELTLDHLLCEKRHALFFGGGVWHMTGDFLEERELDHLVEKPKVLGLSTVPRATDQRESG